MKIREVKLLNFKAFERFTVTFGEKALLVGANNAGKSTIISAVRAVARMIRIAKARRFDEGLNDEGLTRYAYRFSARAVDLIDENLRYEFRPNEVRVQVGFSDEKTITAVWPHPDMVEGGDAPECFFYLDTETGPPSTCMASLGTSVHIMAVSPSKAVATR
jgi:predicted ATP-dependent endonuclease of OLD family